MASKLHLLGPPFSAENFAEFRWPVCKIQWLTTHVPWFFLTL